MFSYNITAIYANILLQNKESFHIAILYWQVLSDNFDTIFQNIYEVLPINLG